jgi:hypothetical protein
LLSLVEVELVDDGQDAVCEVGDAVAGLVVAGQVLALGGEGVAAVLEVFAAGVGVGGAALQFGQVQQPGLVEVSQAPAFGLDAVQAPVEAGELGGEQLVVGGGGACRDSLLAGGQDVGA